VFSRRRLVELCLLAGVAAPIVSFLERKVEALPRGEDTDLAVLSAAIALEHHAIAIYAEGLHRGLFPPGLKHYAVEFKGDHEGHRDTQIAITEERGGRAPEPLARYVMGPLHDGDDLVAQALEIEIAAQAAYKAVISQIRENDYLLSAAFILIDEVRHMTVWRRVRGLRIY
jgi:hypothetical protein